ncbi:MAG: homoserine dehydrogenase [Synergistaceae bacterium]|jgi:homoserine dehydrogenase|nr:homoserine dehydrogenase [Synergistaceae bacterium]
MVYRIGIAGCGTVGRGLVALLGEKREYLEKKYGFRFTLNLVSDFIKGTVASDDGMDPADIIKNLNEKGDLRFMKEAQEVTGTNPLANLLARTPVDILCDATPTNYETGEPSLGILRTAIQSGAHAVTCSKGGVGLDLAGLQELASAKDVQIRYESSVLSGTPLLNLVRGPLAGCVVEKVMGIVNGTTNYILTMMEGGAGYAESLKEAQRLGYAETDPTGDVEGFDSAVKVCIMAQEFFGRKLNVAEIDRQGITALTVSDVKTAQAEGKRIKLIAGIERNGDSVSGYVKPIAVGLSHPLASVMGATNAVCLTTDSLGDVTIIGPGAGAKETAQGLLSDMLSIQALSYR